MYTNRQMTIIKSDDKSSHIFDDIFPGTCMPVDDDFLVANGYYAVPPVPDITKFQVATFVNGDWQISNISLASAQTIQMADVNVNREAKFLAGFSYGGYTWDIDETAKANMLSARLELLAGATNPTGGFWRSKDNVDVAMTDVELRTFLDAAYAWGMQVYATSFAKKNAIAAMTTVADVAAADTSV